MIFKEFSLQYPINWDKGQNRYFEEIDTFFT